MPYAAQDRQEFIKRSNLNPDARVLDLGGVLSGELPSAVYGITAPRPLANAIIIKPELLPFKNSVFDFVVSYHYLDLISPDRLGYAFEEIGRALAKGSNFCFMITQWTPQNDAQRSSLLFNELLKGTGALYQHEFENISMLLSESGFGEITVESIKRDIHIPQEFIKSHFLMLGNLVKKEKEQGGDGRIRALAKQYFNNVKASGEAMLPAIHFTAKIL